MFYIYILFSGHLLSSMSYILDYGTDAQMAMTSVSIDNLIPLFTEIPSRYPWLGDMAGETISQLLVLAKLAYDGTKEDRLIFHGIGGALETLGRDHRVWSVFTHVKVWSVMHMSV